MVLPVCEGCGAFLWPAQSVCPCRGHHRRLGSDRAPVRLQ
ncbi:hypothetical protein [Polaromonas sp. JS666]